MRRLSVPVLSTLLALLAIALLAPGLGPVSGAIPNPADGKFYGCMVKDTGAIKLINYPKVDDCKKGQRLIDWGSTGPQGPGGPQGLGGPQGVQGSPGITKITLTTVLSALETLPASSALSATATCGSGKVVGGGYQLGSADMRAYSDFPSGPTSWTVSAYNPSVSPQTLQAYAICMTTEPSTVIAKAGKGSKSKAR